MWTSIHGRTGQASVQRHGSVADVIELTTWTGQCVDDIVRLTRLGTGENVHSQMIRASETHRWTVENGFVAANKAMFLSCWKLYDWMASYSSDVCVGIAEGTRPTIAADHAVASLCFIVAEETKMGGRWCASPAKRTGLHVEEIH